MSTVKSGFLTLACADLDARPLFWTDHNLQRHGYEPAVAERVASQLGLELKWEFLRWAEFVPALEQGLVDAIWCGCAITEERSRQFIFSKPYAWFDESVLVLSDSGIKSPEHLVGKTVGAIAGSTNMALAEQWPQCKKLGFDGASDNVFQDMIDALLQGKIDAVVDDEPAFGAQRIDPRFSIAFKVSTQNPWGAAMRLNQHLLKENLDDALSQLTQNHGLSKIWKQWLTDIPVPESLKPV